VQFPQGGRLIWDFPEDRYQEGRVERAFWVGQLLSIGLHRNDVLDAPLCSSAHQRVQHLVLDVNGVKRAPRREAAAPLYELMEPWPDQMVWNGAITYGDVRTYLGLLAATLGWDERADGHLALACELQEQKGLLLWTARARLGWAEALARRGERERAGAEAARALQLAREHGYGAIERRAAALAKTGAAALH
jgi:hypothetical protein